MGISRIVWLAGLGFLASFLSSCGGSDELPDVDCETAEVVSFAEVDGFAKCTNCHSSSLSGNDRNRAPSNLNFDVYENAADHSDKIAEEVNEGEMPPSGYPDLTSAEKEQLYAWSLCGTPE